MNKRNIKIQLNNKLSFFSNEVLQQLNQFRECIRSNFCIQYHEDIQYHKDKQFIRDISKENLNIDIFKEKLFISGGAIVSLYFDEEVNDYDIYAKDEKTVDIIREYALCKFNLFFNTEFKYSKRYNKFYHCKLNQFDIDIEQDRIEDVVFYECISSFDYLCINNNCNKDDEKFKGIVENYLNNSMNVVYLTINAITFSDGYQFITRFYGKPEDVMANFDFKHVKNYFDFETLTLVLNIDAIDSLLTKQLYYDGTKYPICSIMRMKKYIKKGWKISASDILKICYQISNLNLNNIDVLKDQIMGVSTSYFIKFIDNLSQINNITPEIIFNLLDSVYEEIDD